MQVRKMSFWKELLRVNSNKLLQNQTMYMTKTDINYILSLERVGTLSFLQSYGGIVGL